MNEFELDQKLIDEAVSAADKARSRSYVPYSQFRMGAAVITDKGIIVPGSLVENVSLGLAMCAERIALFSCISQDLGKPKLLVLVSERTDGKLTFPCGACLQVAMELGGPELEIVACDRDGKKDREILANLGSRLPRKT